MGCDDETEGVNKKTEDVGGTKVSATKSIRTIKPNGHVHAGDHVYANALPEDMDEFTKWFNPDPVPDTCPHSDGGLEKVHPNLAGIGDDWEKVDARFMNIPVETCDTENERIVILNITKDMKNKPELYSGKDKVSINLYDVTIHDCPVFSANGQTYAWTGIDIEKMPVYDKESLWDSYNI